MGSRRQHKFASLFYEELGKIFIEEGRNWFGAALITVTDVEFSPDLRNAKVFISIMGVEDQQAFLTTLQEHKGEIKRVLGQRLRNEVRKIPDITFHIDDSLDRAARIEELLKN